jgi:flagellar biosynthesis chaperone FliJ
MFWNKKINSDEYEKLAKKITEMSEEISTVSNNLKILETNYNDLRGKFNRKLAGIKQSENNDSITEEKDINNPVILPWNGTFR